VVTRNTKVLCRGRDLKNVSLTSIDWREIVRTNCKLPSRSCMMKDPQSQSGMMQRSRGPSLGMVKVNGGGYDKSIDRMTVRN
jgi:hypothetical protein